MDVTPAALRQPGCPQRPQIRRRSRRHRQEGVLGHGNKPANDNPIAPTINYAIDPQPIHKYDPDKAKSLLKKAGLDKLKIDLSASDAAFTGAVDCRDLFKDHAAAANIDINVIRESDDGYWDVVWLKKPWSPPIGTAGRFRT